MAQPRELRRRIKSVENTRQITKTMEMVATSKMKRAQDRVVAARPYAAALAEIIAELYRQRWTIELFFRFFKHVLGCRHLLSTARAGIEIQTYMAIIACLLLALWTGGKPTLRTYEMVCLYLQGWANEEELLAHLAKLKKSDG